MDEEEEWPETWDRNKVYMYTDPTGIKVPVPIGWTVSGAESEKYVDGNVEVKGNLSNLTFTSTGDYPWTQNDDNIWVSGNKGIADSTSELVSNEITVGENGGYVSIEYSVSSQYTYDLLSVTVRNIETGTEEKMIRELSGDYFGNTENSLKYIKMEKELKTGTYTISIKYTKYNNTIHTGLDSGYVKSGTFINYDESGDVTQIIHRQGGLVIYEGDEEINNENAWEESKTRNQFVWVPVENTNEMFYKNPNTGKYASIHWDYSSTLRDSRTGRSFLYGPNNGDTRYIKY